MSGTHTEAETRAQGPAIPGLPACVSEAALLLGLHVVREEDYLGLHCEQEPLRWATDATSVPYERWVRL